VTLNHSAVCRSWTGSKIKGALTSIPWSKFALTSIPWSSRITAIEPVCHAQVEQDRQSNVCVRSRFSAHYVDRAGCAKTQHLRPCSLSQFVLSVSHSSCFPIAMGCISAEINARVQWQVIYELRAGENSCWLIAQRRHRGASYIRIPKRPKAYPDAFQELCPFTDLKGSSGPHIGQSLCTRLLRA
jgi:hypothetical protein